MTHTFAITNQKGGVGKTTTSINVAASLAFNKKKVLFVDLDPQGNGTMGCGIEKNDCLLTMYDVLLGYTDINQAKLYSESGKFDVLPSNADLTAAEVELLQVPNKEYTLKNSLELVESNYDFILIDCPPSLNMLTVNAMAASHGVIIPIQCEYFALEGLSALMNTVAQVGQALNPKIVIEGLVRTMYDPRNSLTNQVSDQLKQHFGNRVYETVIPRNVRLAEAPSHGEPILSYDPQSKGSLAYLKLAEEILKKTQGVFTPDETRVSEETL